MKVRIMMTVVIKEYDSKNNENYIINNINNDNNITMKKYGVKKGEINIITIIIIGIIDLKIPHVSVTSISAGK